MYVTLFLMVNNEGNNFYTFYNIQTAEISLDTFY